MICFHEDWAKYPDAIPHLSTNNKSFLNLAKLYRDMGKKNAYFLLALHQPELQHLDPHSDDLTEDEKFKIAVECKYNIWYFLREVIRVPGGDHGVPLRANRGNIALVWLHICNIDVALIQPRQTGKSVSTDGIMLWLLYFGNYNKTIGLITKDHSLRVGNVERLKKFRQLLPGYLYSVDRSDTDNQIELTNIKMKNKYETAVAQNSEMMANNVFRGKTLPTIQCDEGPFIPWISITLPAALAATTEASQQAAKEGKPHGNIFTTTAGKKDDRDGKYMYSLIHNGLPWTEDLLDLKDKVQLREFILANVHSDENGVKRILVNCTFNHRQLGFTDDWLYERIGKAGGTEEQINRDWFNVWTSGTQNSPLSIKLNEIIKNSVREPIRTEFTKEGYAIRWYAEPSVLASGHYFMGLDTSEALGGTNDDIAMVLVDIRDMSVVAQMAINETNLFNFANWLALFLIDHTTVTLIPERKSSATSIIGTMCLILQRYGVDPFERIFNHIVQDQHQHPEKFKEIQQSLSRRSELFYDDLVKYFGFVTGANNRDELYGNTLQNAAKQAGHLVRDKTLVTQITGLVVKKGRIDHTSSGHDDSVIAWLLTHWLATQGRYLEYYGVDTRQLMKFVTEETRTMTEREVKVRENQAKIKQEIEELVQRLGKGSGEIEQMRIEHRLRFLYPQVTWTEGSYQNVDELLRSIKDQRKVNNRMNTLNRNTGYRPQRSAWDSNTQVFGVR